MILVVAGGRDYVFDTRDMYFLDDIVKKYSMTSPIKMVLTGGASGADWCGLMWANIRGYPYRIHYADWERLGKAAGPIRNRVLAERGTVLAVFPGGKGTENMIKQAETYGLEIIKREENRF